MRTLIFLLLSCFLFSQPNATPNTDSIDIPSEVKPNVEKIINNAEEVKKASEQLNKEINKQLGLMKEIKAKIYQLKSNPKGTIIVAKKNIKKDTFKLNEGIKNNEIFLEVDGQIVQWEVKERTSIGKLLHAGDYLYYPFIVDSNGNKLYIKLK